MNPNVSSGRRRSSTVVVLFFILALAVGAQIGGCFDYCSQGEDWGRRFPVCYGHSHQSPVTIDLEKLTPLPYTATGSHPSPLSFRGCQFGEDTPVFLENIGTTFQVSFRRNSSSRAADADGDDSSDNDAGDTKKRWKRGGGGEEHRYHCRMTNPHTVKASYSFSQLLIHVGAEHRFASAGSRKKKKDTAADGDELLLPQRDFELHFVFKRSLGTETKLLVVAVQGVTAAGARSRTTTSTDTSLAADWILEHIFLKPNARKLSPFTAVDGDGEEEKTLELRKRVSLSELLPRNPSYVYYTGSLTIPPCTEGVDWFVLLEPIVVSQQTVEGLRSMMKADDANCAQKGRKGNVSDFNVRPPQPIHGRPLFVSTQDYTLPSSLQHYARHNTKEDFQLANLVVLAMSAAAVALTLESCYQTRQRRKGLPPGGERSRNNDVEDRERGAAEDEGETLLTVTRREAPADSGTLGTRPGKPYGTFSRRVGEE